jgi:hypothetical protein
MEDFEQVVALQSTVFPPEESYSINQILELCTLETVLYKFQRRLPEGRVALQSEIRPGRKVLHTHDN